MISGVSEIKMICAGKSKLENVASAVVQKWGYLKTIFWWVIRQFEFLLGKPPGLVDETTGKSQPRG